MTDQRDIRIREKTFTHGSESSGKISIDPGEVHLWRVDLDTLSFPQGELPGMLDDSERGRALRFKRTEDRDRYVAAHAALRSILAEYIGEGPQKISLAEDRNGKPVVNTPEWKDSLSFNMSYSGGIALIAVAAGVEVGVDVETHDEEKVSEDTIEGFMTPGEIAFIDTLPSTRRTKAILDIWTAKEAAAKGMGLGLGLPFQTMSVEYSGVGSGKASLHDNQWQIFSMDGIDGFSAAVAVGHSSASL